MLRFEIRSRILTNQIGRDAHSIQPELMTEGLSEASLELSKIAKQTKEKGFETASMACTRISLHLGISA